MSRTATFFLLLFLSGVAVPGTGQFTEPFFTTYTTLNGLSDDQVMALVRDGAGYLWVGTADGLNRFDGRTFRGYRPEAEDRTSLPHSQILGLTPDREGRLWVSTGGGLCHYDPATGGFLRISTPENRDSIAGNDWVSKLVFDRQGRGWGYSAGHLITLQPGDTTVRTIPLPEKNQIIYSLDPLTIDNQGQVWLTSAYKLYRFDPQRRRFKTYSLPLRAGSVDPVYVWCVAVDESGTVWCGTRDHGLFRYDARLDLMEHLLDNGLFVRCLAFGPEGECWVGGGKDGLYRLDMSTRRIEPLTGPPGNANRHNGSWVNKIYRDTVDGITWFATQEGLEKFDPSATRFHRAEVPVASGLNYPLFVLNVIPDRRDPSGEHFWLKIIERGLIRWNIRTRTAEEMPGKGGQAAIGKANECLVQDRLGRLWVNQYNEPGLQLFDPASRRWMPAPVPAPFLSASYVREDRKGNIWIGTFDNQVGYYSAATRQWAEISFFRRLLATASETDIVAIAEDTRGQVWVLTDRELFRVDAASGSVEPLRLSGDFPVKENFLSLLPTRSGELWIGAREGALRLDAEGRLLRYYELTSGLRRPSVFELVEDPAGNVWLGANTGLYRWDCRTEEVREYNKSDGLLSKAAYFLSGTKDGWLFIGHKEAFSFARTDRFASVTPPPPVVIAGVQVMDEERHLGDDGSLTLYPGENYFTVSFAALQFHQPEKSVFSYKLEGFDTDWHSADSRNQATYTNLNGGRYRFLVRAANYEGIWSENEAVLSIRVIPPFYRTLLFRVLAALGITFIVAAFLAVRWRQRARLEAIRRRIARDLHDDMGSTLSSIRFFSESVRAGLGDQRPELAPMLQRISNNAAELLDSMKDIVWTLNPNNDQGDDLVVRMREFGAKVLEAQQVQFAAQAPEEVRTARLAVDQRRNLYLIFKEAVNNAVKYSECTELHLHLGLQARQLRMVISDNGRGFDPRNIGRGNGLLNMKKRAAEIGGNMRIDTRPGQGARIEVTAPLRRRI